MHTYLRRCAFGALLLVPLALGCSDESGTDGDSADDAGAAAPDLPPHAERLAALRPALPPNTRGAAVVDLATLLAGDARGAVEGLIRGESGDPALGVAFGAIGRLTAGLTGPEVVATALLGQTTDAAAGLFLVGRLTTDLDSATREPLEPDGTHGVHPLFRDAAGHQVARLPDGGVVIGRPDAVRSVLDAADAAAPDTGAIAPFLSLLAGDAAFEFAYGLRGLDGDPPAPAATLEAAAAMSGALRFSAAEVEGAIHFHTTSADAFVEAYNALNRHASQPDPPLEAPLTVEPPVADGLPRVVVPVPATPIDPSPDAALVARNHLKKLFVGMAAHHYAEGVADPGNPAWVDLVVVSEAEGGEPPSPGSVFIRWDFKDQAAIEAFEANELPAGFRLARCQFFESDDPEGEYFLALNLYNAGGGAIVDGTRAEWDVFVDPPVGADPDAGTRPRFMVIDALAQAVSADPVHLVTSAEPLSHTFEGDRVTTRVGRFEGGETVPVFESAFPKPDPANAPVARFTREMAIGNDYIYWGHGVYDRVVYNATTFNHDAYFVDPTAVTVRDDSHWAQYLADAPRDVVYYVNTLEYIASPMANLRSDFLDITPAWREALLAFKTNGHQLALMRNSVELLFRGVGDAVTPMRVPNATPSAHYVFPVTDPEGLAAVVELPPAHALMPIAIVDGEDPAHALTLAVYEVDGAPEGTRAEWHLYAAGPDGRPRTIVADVVTEHPAVHPVRAINLPGDLRHASADGALATALRSETLRFEGSQETDGARDAALSLDWIEAGDHICYSNGVCDKRYYDAETLDVLVRLADATVDRLETPWDPFIDATPRLAFHRVNARELAVKRWESLKVPVDELPFSGLADATHWIGGSGTLVGRDTDVVDSEYTYSGDARLEDGTLHFAIDQRIDNLLGEAHIYTTGRFDLANGVGSQTVQGCVGPALMCSDVVDGSTALYTAQGVDTSDPDRITWSVDLIVDLGGMFGLADSASQLEANLAE
jgi:hypothetical protein